jgi:hypothetical protein
LCRTSPVFNILHVAPFLYNKSVELSQILSQKGL